MLVTFEAKKPEKSSKVTDIPTSSSSSSSLLNTTSQSSAIKIEQDEPYLQNVKLNDGTDSKVFKFTKKKSKGGCITCKIRKKRCSDDHPICSDCQRLGKNCVWATEDMSIEEVRALKKKVEKLEETTKLKRKNATASSDKPSKKRVISSNNDDVGIEQIVFDNKLHDVKKEKYFDPHSTRQHSPDAIHHDEFNYKAQTPIAANLIYLSTGPNSPFLPPLSPRWDLQSNGDQFFEFNSLLESNLRSTSDKSQDKIVALDNNEADTLNNDNDDDHALDTDHTSLSSTKGLMKGRSPFAAFETVLGDSPFFDFSHHHILLSPSPQELNLNSLESHLYDYYRNRLSGIVSIVPPESNYYTKVFLPMASVNPGVLYSILAWSAYHLGGDYEHEGDKLMAKAYEYIKNTAITSNSDALQRLANFLIMCAAEICKGDVKKWPFFLQQAAKLIKDRGGLFKFNQDKEQHWLISSFAYHDILASSTSERGTYFPVEDYDNFIVNLGFGVDPLQGIVKPLFNIIGEISSFATESKKLLKISSNSLGYGIMNDDEDDYDDLDDLDIPGIDDSPDSYSASGTKKKVSRYSSLLRIMQKASMLENKINVVKPNPEDLQSFSSKELELQLTLFELFQLTAKLHLRQSVLRLNPSSLETQFILCELLKCLDIVLKSSVEGSLCFPLFIAGMNCTTKRDRRMMLERFKDIIGRYSFKNLERAKTIMEQVWMIDPTGTRCVDWYEIIKSLGWDLSFA